MHDVARHAGVSSMTVSRFVNGANVRADSKRKIEAALKELHYVPNLAARAARSGSHRLGILFNNPRSSNLGDFFMGAFRQAGEDGNQLLIEPVAGHADPIDAVRKVLDAGVAGIILPPPLCDSLDALELVWQARVHALSFATADPRSHSSAVLINDFEGARAMTRALIQLGHKHIGFVRGDVTHSPALRREEGFRAAMAEAGYSTRPDWIMSGDFSYRSGLEAATALLALEERPTAIFASNDDMAAAVLAVALGNGLSIPADVSVAGFDDTPIASLMWPQLTTVHQPIAEMAAAAVGMLDRLIRDRRSEGLPPHEHLVVPYELKLRESTGPAPQKGR
ncbi:LacI family DNA-binding transcriptional regulator [Croceibacterium sp. TMG7-5b_MA50]|uniref:LacI family DNA-binding transcriptional regulator n=1 Tax=Croceibacterium sp. TMG7-5b_MA50 TaxID=3121290 RepID=UPI0032214FA3